MTTIKNMYGLPPVPPLELRGTIIRYSAGRSTNGNVRNFASMTTSKLEAAIAAMLDEEPLDHEALDKASKIYNDRKVKPKYTDIVPFISKRKG